MTPTLRRAAVALVLGSFVAGGCSTTDGGDPTAAPATTTSTTATSTTATPREHALSVAGGHGSGTYPAGSTVHVWSSVSTTDEVADPWSGDVALLAEPDEWRTSFVMPDRDVSLVANTTGQSLQLATATFTGATSVAKTVRYFLPPQMRGLVVFSHGTGGNSGFIEGAESFPIALALAAEGYGVVSTEAEESAAGDLNGDGKERWNTRAAATNVDLANLEALFDDFEARGLIPSGTPKFALGMSAGGSFSHLLGTVGATAVAPRFEQLRFNAVVGYCADATASRSASRSTTPSAWFMCGEEDNPEVSNAEARANEAMLRGRGIPTDYVEHRPSPLHDERFSRIEGIDTATSAAMAGELRAAGYVDDAGFIRVDGDEIAAAVLDDPAAFPTISSGPPIGSFRAQVKAMRAEHAMYADLTHRNIEFFERFNPGTAG